MLCKMLLFATLFFVASGVNAVSKGDSAPIISLPLLSGEVVSQERLGIDDFKGKLVYVDFWASWCLPCRRSLPILNKIRNQYKTQGFEVVAINVDKDLKDALKFLKKHPVDYPILLDFAAVSPPVYQIRAMPTAYLIDETGKIIYKHEGFRKKDGKKIEKIVSAYLVNR